MSDDDLHRALGPLAPLVGVWEGDEGLDESPSASRGPMETRFRERLVFEVLGAVDNHEQRLFGLRYDTTAWRLGEDEPFHEDRGYWLWDAAEGQVMRCFVVPRGVSILAGGAAGPADRRLELVARVGADVYGIASTPFLDREFKTVRFEQSLEIDDDTLRYAQDTQLLLKDRSDVFHHRDANFLRRAG